MRLRVTLAIPLAGVALAVGLSCLSWRNVRAQPPPTTWEIFITDKACEWNAIQGLYRINWEGRYSAGHGAMREAFLDDVRIVYENAQMGEDIDYAVEGFTQASGQHDIISKILEVATVKDSVATKVGCN